MTWKDINFKQYTDLMYFYENINQYDNDLDKTIGLLVIFYPMVDIDEMYELPFIEVQQMIAPILEVLNTKMVYETLPYMNLEEMTYGEWINFEIYIKASDFQSIFNTLYKDEEIDLEVKSPIDLLGSYEDLIKYRSDTYKHFSELFKLDNGDDTPDADETPEEREERQEIEKDNKNNSEWSWYLYTYDITNGDITKFDEMFEKNHLFIFNILHMKKKFKLNEVYRGAF